MIFYPPRLRFQYSWVNFVYHILKYSFPISSSDPKYDKIYLYHSFLKVASFRAKKWKEFANFFSKKKATNKFWNNTSKSTQYKKLMQIFIDVWLYVSGSMCLDLCVWIYVSVYVELGRTTGIFLAWFRKFF